MDLKSKIKPWYAKEHPDDYQLDEIDSDATFEQVYEEPWRVYEIIGEVDSMIREEVFAKISDLADIDYDEIYQKWLYGGKKTEKKTEALYKKGKNYGVKYTDTKGKDQEITITPEKDMSIAGMISECKSNIKDFFKLQSIEGAITGVTESNKIHSTKQESKTNLYGALLAEARNKLNSAIYEVFEKEVKSLKTESRETIKNLINKFKLDESKTLTESTSRSLYDYLEEHDFEDYDIVDETYDMETAYCLDPKDTDPMCVYLVKLAKQLKVIKASRDTITVNLTSYVSDNFDTLESIFDLSGNDKEECIEELVCDIMPGVLAGYVTNDVYSQLNNTIKTESKLQETGPRTYFDKLDYDDETFEALVEIENNATLDDMKKIADKEFLDAIYSKTEFWNFLLGESNEEIRRISKKYFSKGKKSDYVETNERENVDNYLLESEKADSKFKVELNGIKETLKNQDEVDSFEAMKRSIKGLENKVKTFDSNSIVFGNKDEQEFLVEFDLNSYGKVKQVVTVSSNLVITKEFISLAEELLKLK